MAKYKEIKYGTVFPGSNLTDFPKLFEISLDTDIAAELALGGGIELYLADGVTTAPFGLYPSTNLSLGTILMRVKMDPLTAATTGDVMLRLRYGSGLTTVEDKAGVVSNNYALFMPMEEDPSGSAPQMFDWVTETNVGTSSVGMTSGDLVPGQVGNALSFDGSTYVATNVIVDYPFTVSVWTLQQTSSQYGPCTTRAGFGTSGFELLNIGSSYAFFCAVTGGGFDGPFVGTPPTLGTWVKLDCTIDATGLVASLYQDGVFQGSTTLSNTFAANISGGIALGTSPSRTGANTVDDTRVSSVVRSADWLAYAYADESTNSDTFSLGPEQTEGGAAFVASLPFIVSSQAVAAANTY